MSSNALNPVEFCRQLAAPQGSANYYATLYLPATQQAPAWAVLALRQELSNVVTKIAEPSVAQARLDWWQAELHSAAQNHAQHPIAQALSQYVLQHAGHDALLDEMLHGAYARLHSAQIENASDFALMSYRQDTAAWLILTDMDGEAGRMERDFAHAIGSIFTWTRVLHMLGRDAAQGEIWIPQMTLQQHNLTAADLMQPRTTERVRAMLAELGQHIRQHIQHAKGLLPATAQRKHIMAFVSLAHAEALLKTMQKHDWNLLESRPELTPLQLLWTAWRTAGKARRGKIKPI
ncbi:MAG: phytoene/squalene synthase family protein [Halothiobacillaceae bacterium]